MALIKVKFTVVMTQEIEWGDDELDHPDYGLTHDNLYANLDVDKASHDWNFDIVDVKKNGDNHNF